MKSSRLLDARFERHSLLAADDLAFAERMLEVDNELRDNGFAIFQRPLQALGVVCQKGGFSLNLDEPLASRIKAWFEVRYGDRVLMDMSLGYGPVMIRGEMYRMRSPLVLFGYRVVCVAGSAPQFGPVPILNVLDFIEGLTSQVKDVLLTGELYVVQKLFRERQTLFSALIHVLNNKAFATGLGDLESAEKHLFLDRPQLGLARWDCLQAVEKFLKGWIRYSGAVPMKTHDLNILLHAAVRLGLTDIAAADMVNVQCQPGIRYGDGLVKPDEVTLAFDTALRCCASIASHIHKSSQLGMPPRPQRLDGMNRTAFLSLKRGDIIRSGDIVLTIMDLAQSRPRWYFARAEGASENVMIVEDDHRSFRIVKQGPIWLE